MAQVPCRNELPGRDDRDPVQCLIPAVGDCALDHAPASRDSADPDSGHVSGSALEAELLPDGLPGGGVVPRQESLDVLALYATPGAGDGGVVSIASDGLPGTRCGGEGPCGEWAHAARR